MRVHNFFNNTEKAVDIQKKRLRDACLEFESIFTAQLLKKARDGMLRAEEPDNAMSLYESMFDEAVAKEIGAKGVFGLADLLYQELLPLVESKQIRLRS